MGGQKLDHVADSLLAVLRAFDVLLDHQTKAIETDSSGEETASKSLGDAKTKALMARVEALLPALEARLAVHDPD